MKVGFLDTLLHAKSEYFCLKLDVAGYSYMTTLKRSSRNKLRGDSHSSHMCVKPAGRGLRSSFEERTIQTKMYLSSKCKHLLVTTVLLHSALQNEISIFTKFYTPKSQEYIISVRPSHQSVTFILQILRYKRNSPKLF